ncbi:MAG: dTMP kinase [Defluviitaleaceae bacterium]|nr:dTMP kinase [Defluviitaleaceae bacterium]
MKKGAFIAFEGLDGSGKTTQFNAIMDKLSKLNITCKEEREPSDHNPIGLMIRDIVKGTHGIAVSPISLAKLFSVDRYEHVVNDIKPFIDNGGHVLIDRYIVSSFAYQGLSCSFDEIYFYNKDVIKLLMPDLTIFIDTAPAICLDRINKTRIEKELFDDKGIALQQKYYEAIDKLKHDANILTIDGNQPLDLITNEIWKAIEPYMCRYQQ